MKLDVLFFCVLQKRKQLGNKFCKICLYKKLKIDLKNHEKNVAEVKVGSFDHVDAAAKQGLN
jgi:hypothetical protein